MLFSGDFELKYVSARQRVAHYPEVRNGIKKSLDHTKTEDNPEVFKGLAQILVQIIDFEQQNKSGDSDKIIDNIVETNFEGIKSIARALQSVHENEPEVNSKSKIRQNVTQKKPTVIRHSTS